MRRVHVSISMAWLSLALCSSGVSAADLRWVAGCERSSNSPNVRWEDACVDEAAFAKVIPAGHLIVHPSKNGPSWVGFSCDGLVGSPSRFGVIEHLYLEADGRFWGPLWNATGSDVAMCGRVSTASAEETFELCLDIMEIWGEDSEHCFTLCEPGSQRDTPQICVWHSGLDEAKSTD